VSPQKVLEFQKQIGHPIRRAGAADMGVPGQYFAATLSAKRHSWNRMRRSRSRLQCARTATPSSSGLRNTREWSSESRIRLAQRLPDRHARIAFRGRLGLSCARRSWPVWQAAFPEETKPMAAAEAAVAQAIAGKPDTAHGRELLGELKTDLDERLLFGEALFAAVYAGFSCWATVRDMLEPGATSLPVAESELQLDLEDWDPCFSRRSRWPGGRRGMGWGTRRSEECSGAGT
jgi:Immunity protein Imm5